MGKTILHRKVDQSIPHTPEDLANMVMYLASEAASYATGRLWGCELRLESGRQLNVHGAIDEFKAISEKLFGRVNEGESKLLLHEDCLAI